MKLSTTTINNVDECYIVSATSTYGIGFITYIAYSLCSFFGLPSSKMAEKIDMAKAEATHEITKQATDMKADGIMGIRYQMSFLSVMAYGTAYKNKKEPVTESASKNNTKTVKPEAAESYENPNSSSATENAKKQFVDDNTIICSFCNYKQAANRNVCWHCGKSFDEKENSTDTSDVPYWCGKCHKAGPYDGECPSCGSSIKRFNTAKK